MSKITLLTFEELVFPGIEQEVVVFIGEKGDSEKGIKIVELNNLEDLENLILQQYVAQVGGSRSKYGEPIPILENTLFTLNDLGIAEVESKQWFNLQFVLTQIVLPIIIAIITTLITIFLAA